MPSRLVAVAFDARDPDGLGAFWGELLGREVVHEAGRVRLPGVGTQVGLEFVAAPPAGTGHPRLHLHLTSTSLEDQRQTAERIVSLGGRPLDVGQLPQEDHVVLGDPEGNAVCVIPPGNRFLAGCGLLAEVTCDGHREVGLFWAESLGWPLVWDQDDETAVQSPAGGTKVSWDGKGTTPKQAGNPQRFELAAADPVAELARLVSLGATWLGEADGRVELADPEGNEFWVRVG